MAVKKKPGRPATKVKPVEAAVQALVNETLVENPQVKKVLETQSFKLISMSQVYLCNGDSTTIEVAVDATVNVVEDAKGIVVMNCSSLKEPVFIHSTYCEFGNPFKVRVTNLNRTPKRINKGEVVGLCLVVL